MQLVILLSLIFIPALILTIRASLNQQRVEKDKVRAQTVALAKLCAAKHQAFVEKAKQLLITISQIQFLSQGTDATAARFHFVNLCKLMPEYADFGLIETNGEVFANAIGTGPGFSVTNWSCLQRVLVKQAFAIGNVDTNGPLHKETLDMGYPVLDQKGNVVRMIYASLPPEELRKVAETIALPRDTTLSMYDRKGTVLFRVGKEPSAPSLNGSDWTTSLLQPNEEVFEKKDVDEVDRLYAVATISDSSKLAVVISVTVPTATSFAAANQLLWKRIAAMCTIFLAALLAAYFYSEHFLLRPLSSLMQSARRLGANEWHPADETAIKNSGELGELARTFNHMARTLEERRKQLQASHEEVRKLNSELEKRVEERTAELAAANRELERFSYSVSHDLRAPLRAMQNFAAILKDDFSSELSAEARDYLDRIDRAASRLDVLTMDLLVYSKVAAVQLPLEPVDLNVLVKDVLATYPNFSAAQFEVQPLPTVMGQRSYLTQCFSNLISNAIKFVAPGHKPQVKIGATCENGTACIWIADNGIGIAPEHKNRVFDIFERLHPQHGFEGTGIGLAIVRAAVERMSGQLGFESKVGEGSRFWIKLAVASRP